LELRRLYADLILCYKISQDLTVLTFDFSLGHLQESVYRIPISGLDDVKDRVRTFWENLDHQIINIAVIY